MAYTINRFDMQDNATTTVVDGTGVSGAGPVADATLVPGGSHTTADISVTGPGVLPRALKLSAASNDVITGLGLRGEDSDGCGLAFWFKSSSTSNCVLFRSDSGGGIDSVKIAGGKMVITDDNPGSVTLDLPGVTLTNWNHFGFITYLNPGGGDDMFLEFYINGAISGTAQNVTSFESAVSWRMDQAGKTSNGADVSLAGVAFNQRVDIAWDASTIAALYAYRGSPGSESALSPSLQATLSPSLAGAV